MVTHRGRWKSVDVQTKQQTVFFLFPRQSTASCTSVLQRSSRSRTIWKLEWLEAARCQLFTIFSLDNQSNW